MKDWLKCQISPLVKYRQNQNQKRTFTVGGARGAERYQVQAVIKVTSRLQ